MDKTDKDVGTGLVGAPGGSPDHPLPSLAPLFPLPLPLPLLPCASPLLLRRVLAAAGLVLPASGSTGRWRDRAVGRGDGGGGEEARPKCPLILQLTDNDLRPAFRPLTSDILDGPPFSPTSPFDLSLLQLAASASPLSSPPPNPAETLPPVSQFSRLESQSTACHRFSNCLVDPLLPSPPPPGLPSSRLLDIPFPLAAS